jgi:hypothetical protein
VCRGWERHSNDFALELNNEQWLEKLKVRWKVMKANSDMGHRLSGRSKLGELVPIWIPKGSGSEPDGPVT